VTIHLILVLDASVIFTDYNTHPLHRYSNIIPNIMCPDTKYKGWNFNSGNYLFTTDTK